MVPIMVAGKNSVPIEPMILFILKEFIKFIEQHGKK
jgi:hypothetical protein